MLIIYAAVAAMAVCVAWALLPAPESYTLRAPAPQFPTDVFGVGSATVREIKRSPVRALLELLGRLLPVSKPAGDALQGRILYAGSELSAQAFRGLQVFTSVLGLVLGAVLANEFARAGLLGGLLAAAVGFLIPQVWLRARIARRQRTIVRLLPEVIDLLALCVGAGLDFIGALNKVLFLKDYHQEPLIQELSLAMQEMKLGKRKVEAMRAMAKRVNLPELSSFVRTLVQADRMGTPISDVFAIHAEDMRLQRFMKAEREALKAPIKILMPLVLCIMPCVAIIVGAPILLQFMRQNPFSQ